VGETPTAPHKSVLNLVKPVEQGQTATPIPGVLVVATQTSGGSSSSWALTDKNGIFTINSGLTAGTYKVTAGGYDLQLLGETAGYVACTINGIVVTAGQESVNNDVSLNPSAWISGTITGSNGQPIFRAFVTANSTSGFSGYEYTNETGFYRINTGLNSSTYTVTAKYQGFSQSKTGVIATAPNETKNINFQMTGVPAGGEVIGRITSAVNGLGIGSATVQISGLTNVQTKTDPKGYYSYFLGSGSYLVSTLVPGFASNKTNAQVTSNQITRIYYPATATSGFQVSPLSGASSGKISGAVTGQSSPIPEFPVAVIPAVFSIAVFLTLLSVRRLKRNKNNRA